MIPSFMYPDSVVLTKNASDLSSQGGSNPSPDASGTYDCSIQPMTSDEQQQYVEKVEVIDTTKMVNLYIPYNPNNTLIPTLSYGDLATINGKIATVLGEALSATGFGQPWKIAVQKSG